MSQAPRIVLVDDEDMVIASISAFLMLETDWDVHGFTSPEEAIKHLESHRADVVVSDYRMPKVDGIQMLRRAKELHPAAARVLLTGHAGKQSAIQAINCVGLYQYLEKPWDNSQLHLVLKSATERTALLRTLEEKISELDTAHSSLKDAQTRLLRAFL